MAAVALKDVEKLRAIDAAFEESPSRGRRITALRAMASGAIAVLDGQRDEGTVLLKGFLAMQAKLDLAGVRAEGQVMVARVVGTENEFGQSAAAAALEWFEEVGAHGFIELYSDVLPLEDAAEAASG